jgi:hypothetical protein
MATTNNPKYLKQLADKILAVLKSRKFWAAVTGTLVVLQSGASSEEIATRVAAIWIAYILGTAVEDGLRGFRGSA